MSDSSASGDTALGDGEPAQDSPSGNPLQAILDAGSQELGRALALEDRQMRLLAFTQHEEQELDAVRGDSILKRAQVNPGVMNWIHEHEVATAEQPVRIPANPDLEMHARICAPVRCHGYLLGYLWLTDRDGLLADEQLRRMGALAESLGVALYRDLLLRDLSRSRERELLRDILAEDRKVRVDAARQLIELGIVASDGPIAVITVRLPESTIVDEEATRTAVDAALNRVRRQLTPNHALHLLRPDHALLVISLHEPSVRTRGVTTVADKVRDALADVFVDRDFAVQAAVGGRVSGWAKAYVSYNQSLRAAQVAEAVKDGFGSIVSWGDLGIYKILVELPLDQLGPDAIHPGLRSLIDDPKTHFLVATLEAYFDRAGDAQATAAALHMHRTTLHHRLRRAQELGNLNLASGDERLALHLGVKIARLQGLHWAEQRVE